MNIATDSVQTMGLKFVIHGLPNTDTLDENAGIWSLSTKTISTPNITHGGASNHYVGEVTEVRISGGDYREENYKTDFEI